MIEDFLERLKTISYKYYWFLWRGVQIRAILKDEYKTCEGCCDGEFCPITAVIRELDDIAFTVHQAYAERQRAILLAREAEEIILSADGSKSGNPITRQKILEAVGIKDPAVATTYPEPDQMPGQ